MHIVKNNQFFIYAVLLHVAFYMFFMGVGNFIGQTINESVTNKYLKIETYEKAPIKNIKPSSSERKSPKVNQINNQLDKIEKNMLSYSVETPQESSSIKNQKEFEKQAANLNEAEKEFENARSKSKQNRDAIFKRSKELKEISKTYASIKHKEQEIKLNSSMVNNEKQLKKSKSLLLAYESYQKALYNKILSNWVSPQNAPESWGCRVKVTQNKKGEVQKMSYEECVKDKRFRRAVKLAIYRSSPLDLPEKSAIFNETVYFNFKGSSG